MITINYHLPLSNKYFNHFNTIQKKNYFTTRFNYFKITVSKSIDESLCITNIIKKRFYSADMRQVEVAMLLPRATFPSATSCALNVHACRTSCPSTSPPTARTASSPWRPRCPATPAAKSCTAATNAGTYWIYIYSMWFFRKIWAIFISFWKEKIKPEQAVWFL